MLLRFRPLILVLLVLALALPMRLHGLMMAGPAEAAAIHEAGLPPPCHGHDSPDHPSGTGHGPEDRAPAGLAGHAGTHCVAAGLVVPVRAVDVPAPYPLPIEALRPAEMTPGDGLAPPRQERPPRPAA